MYSNRAHNLWLRGRCNHPPTFVLQVGAGNLKARGQRCKKCGHELVRVVVKIEPPAPR